MEDKLHPLTELMLARMKSHPEEFEDGILTYGARWDRAMHEIEKYGSEADKQAMHEGLRPIRLGEAHTWAMDELLNGEERRRKQREEEADYMAKTQSQSMVIQQAILTQNQLAQQSYATGVGHRNLLSGLSNRSKP